MMQYLHYGSYIQPLVDVLPQFSVVDIYGFLSRKGKKEVKEVDDESGLELRTH